jgi:hypothetical protein
MAGGKLISTGVEFPDATTQTTSGLPLTGGALTGAVTTTSTFDGRDVAADGVTADAALPKAGGTMTGTIAGFTSTGIDDNATSTAITIDANEKVGIGTASPSAKLDVWSGSFNSKVAEFTGGNAGRGLEISTFARGSNDDSADFNVPYAGVGAISFSVVGTEKVRVTNAGLTFNGDTAAANALDDYEEGTFTPAITTTGTLGYSNQTGTYTKVGTLVTAFVDVTISSWSGATSSAPNMSLPFATISGGWYSAPIVWHCVTAFTGTANRLIGYTGATGMQLHKSSGASSSDGGAITTNVTGRMSYTVTYRTT